MPTLCCLYRFLALGFASTILSHGSRSSKSTVDLNSNQSLALDDLLQRVTSRLEEGSKYTLFTSDGSGFGNLARGMVATLALSLITNRRFLIDSKSTYFQLFDQPLSKVSISKSSVKFHGLKAYGRKLLRMGQPTQSFAKNILGSLTSAADYIEHDAGCTFADFFYTDEYRDRWRTVFGRDLRWDEIDVLLVMWLFQSPKEELLSNTQRVLDSIHWSTFSQHLVVQYRGFVDVAYKNGKTFDKDIHLIKDQVMLFKSHHQSQLSDVLIYVTSDSFDWSKAIQAHLRKSFPHVVVSSLFPNTHSARADSSDLVKMQGMVDWVILGLARDTICTGSTYCISARARVGMGSPQCKKMMT